MLPLAIGTCIAAYTLLGKEGIARAGPIACLELVTIGPAIAYGLAMLARKGAPALRAELRPWTIVAALGLFGAYALVLGERVSPARARGAALIVAGIVLVGLS